MGVGAGVEYVYVGVMTTEVAKVDGAIEDVTVLVALLTTVARILSVTVALTTALLLLDVAELLVLEVAELGTADLKYIKNTA